MNGVAAAVSYLRERRDRRTRKTRWGILGTGKICNKFADALAVLEDAEISAVASRSQTSADRFAEKHRVGRSYGNYEALAADPDIDAVYIGTPHPMHKDNTLLCLNHGRAVLCEKPFAINARDAGQMVSAARERKVFLMEAMWTRFFPAIAEAHRLTVKGAIGEIRMVKADFCFRSEMKPLHRLFNPELGGGALLDIGVYSVSFAHLFLDREPSTVNCLANTAPTGVDEQTAVLLGYDKGEMAMLSCSIRTTTPNEALVAGTEGWIRFPHPFWQPDRFILCRKEKQKEFVFDRLGNGYTYEAMEVMQCLRKGRLESPVMPLDKTLAVMRTLDRIRAGIGLRYPME